MRVTLQLTPAAAQRVRSRTRSIGSGPLSWLTHQLHPTHPDDDPSLSTFFTIDIVDESAADALLQKLRDDPSVSAAYIKPGDEPA